MRTLIGSNAIDNFIVFCIVMRRGWWQKMSFYGHDRNSLHFLKIYAPSYVAMKMKRIVNFQNEFRFDWISIKSARMLYWRKSIRIFKCHSCKQQFSHLLSIFYSWWPGPQASIIQSTWMKIDEARKRIIIWIN